MSRRSKREKIPTFDFLPIVKEILNLHVDPSVQNREKDIEAACNKFLDTLKEAQRYLTSASGLDMTEEEQEQKIRDLELAIQQKKQLIEECQKCFDSWNQ